MSLHEAASWHIDLLRYQQEQRSQNQEFPDWSDNWFEVYRLQIHRSLPVRLEPLDLML